MTKSLHIRVLIIATMALPLAFISCYCPDDYPIKLPSSATNLQALNSPYDDWNCADPTVYYSPRMNFLFSSNRNTQGGSFDLQPYALVFSHESFEAQVIASLDSVDYYYTNHSGNMDDVFKLAQAINTNQDEIGPSMLRQNDAYYAHYPVMTFTRGDSNSHDLWILRSLDSTRSLNEALHTDSTIQEPLTILNSTADDGYLTYHIASHTLIFHSNRSGVYRLYQAPLPASQTMEQWLAAPTAVDVTELTELSSTDGEERTPFVRDNVLYLISTRSGGQGGRDIWKSEWTSTAGWKAPVNMGSKINSAQDEYRPVVLKVAGASNYPKVLFFSSNREGGLGGYDLHYAGIK